MTIDQGGTWFGRIFSPSETRAFLSALNLDEGSFDLYLPLQLVTTGQPTVIIPVRRGLNKIRVDSGRINGPLKNAGAGSACMVDIDTREGKTLGVGRTDRQPCHRHFGWVCNCPPRSVISTQLGPLSLLGEEGAWFEVLQNILYSVLHVSPHGRVRAILIRFRQDGCK